MLLTERSEPVLLGLHRSGLIRSGDRVLVAVSGGPDSTALLIAAIEDGHDIVAAHYDHALRDGSERVAEHVAALCAQLGVELVAERRQVAMPRGSIQAAARTLRYDFLDRARKGTEAQVVALGHTADDVVEGVMMHLMRGCGLAGLRGMPARRGPFVRPLLQVWRREIVDFLASRGVAALDDPANADTRYERVRMRRQILPALERDRPGITRRFHAAAMQAAARQEGIAARAGEDLRHGAISRSVVADAPEPVAAELLRRLYTAAGGNDPGLSRAHLTSMLRLVQPGPGGRGVDLPGGYRFRVVGDLAQVIASGDHAAQRSSAHLEIARCDGCQSRGAVHLKPGLALRLGFRKPGLRMRPLGGRGTRKLQDIFVDAHVPREERDSWPLVFAGDRLAWVPGIAVDSDLASQPGETALHVTVTRILADRNPMLESPDSPRGEPS
jgi:tRNA(Ile)-lysidine synthetase-like protein